MSTGSSDSVAANTSPSTSPIMAMVVKPVPRAIARTTSPAMLGWSGVGGEVMTSLQVDVSEFRQDQSHVDRADAWDLVARGAVRLGQAWAGTRLRSWRRYAR